MFQKINTYFDNISVEKRLEFILKISCIGLIIGILLSYNLWNSDREIPLLPFFELLPNLPNFINKAFLYALFFLLVSIILSYNRKVFIALFILLSFLLFQDQLKWQPWVYLYYLFFIPFLFKAEEKNKLKYFQIIIIGVYFWSGAHKFQPAFISNTFSSILTNLFHIQDSNLIEKILILGYAIPIIEILTAVFLFTKRFQLLGIILAIYTHIFALLYLGPLGISHNTVVYPWNIAMMFFVIILFYKNNESLSFQIIETLKHGKLIFVAIILTWILPFLNLFGLWDNYLSFSLYSDKTKFYYIETDQNYKFKIDSLNKISKRKKELKQEKKYVDVYEWPLSNLNVPFYPEDRVFKQLIKKLELNNDSSIQYLFMQKENKNESFYYISIN